MLKISVMVSGGGTNLQAIIDGIEKGEITGAEIRQVISSNENAFALERAKKHGIRGRFIGRANYPDDEQRAKAILKALDEEKTDLIVLAGYMSILPEALIEAYRDKIINIHPSLIPKFCGKGFYGKRVHQAVLLAGEKVSGATVHYVDEGVDTGAIILQRQVSVREGDTAETLAERVLSVEHEILKLAVSQLAEEHNKETGEE